MKNTPRNIAMTILSASLLCSCLAATPKSEVFLEDFSEGLDPKRWTISAWTAPHDNSKNNRGLFKKENVKVVGGLLQLRLKQVHNSDGSITSYGGEVKTVAKFGYGTYRLIMKASSDEIDWASIGNPVSGSITGAGVFIDKSATEIDIEVEGLAARSSLTQTSTWVSERLPSETFQVPPYRNNLPHYGFHSYKIIWLPGKITFYMDGRLISTHKRVIPSKPAPFFLNHWGTNSTTWGGTATTGVTRYMYVRRFSFTPIKVEES